ncbi:restriction endonuclease subunit S [Ningiella sp. W23]|uniref:restriction endonuclease subunit S n=1 Tax=Ningiella sp. W23 TaxID=3023715 RepID=UPI003757997D
MENDWDEFVLGEVTSLRNGAGIKQEYFSEAEDAVPLVKVSNFTLDSVDISEFTKVDADHAVKWTSHLLKKKDTLIATVGSWPPNWSSVVGKVIRVPAEAEGSIQNQNTCCILSTEAIDEDFLYYVLRDKNFSNYIVNVAQGSANQARVPVKKIGEYRFRGPKSKLAQAKIGKTLRILDEKLANSGRVSKTLEQMVQALFKSWFVDFDPVIDNVLAAGNDIPDALIKKAELRKQALQLPDFKPLPDSIRTLFPSEFEQTDEPTIGIVGWIPKGWRVSNTDAELAIKGGSTPSTKNPDYWEGGDIHWTSPKDLSGNDSKILLNTSRKITEAGLAKITSGLLPVDTVLMSSRAPVGYLALAKVPLAINQGYIALQCEKDLTPEYTMLFLDSIMDEIKGISGGTTFAEISKKTFRSIKLVVPAKPAIDAFTSIAKTNYDKITENIKHTNSLTETRDYLLPNIVSGEISLAEVNYGR